MEHPAQGYYHQVPCESVCRSHLGPMLTAQKNISTKKDSAGVLVDGTCCPLAALILENSSVSHVFFQQINYKGYILLVLPPEWLCTTNPPKWWRPKAKNLQRSKRKNAAKSQKNNWVTQQLMVQKSGKENQLRLVRVVEIPIIYNGFSTIQTVGGNGISEASTVGIAHKIHTLRSLPGKESKPKQEKLRALPLFPVEVCFHCVFWWDLFKRVETWRDMLKNREVRIHETRNPQFSNLGHLTQEYQFYSGS